MAPKLIKNLKNGSSRISQACDRCRIKKIKCDGSLPNCSNCKKIGFNCKTSDKLTRRSFPKGYTENLEQNLVFLQNENLRLINYIKLHNKSSKDNDFSTILIERENFNVLLDTFNQTKVTSVKIEDDYDNDYNVENDCNDAVSDRYIGFKKTHFNNVLFNNINIGKNIVNHNLSEFIQPMLVNACNDKFLKDSTSNNDDDSNNNNGSINLILDSILFRLFLLASNVNDSNFLLVNNKNLLVINKFIENFFKKFNSNFLTVIDEVEFFTNFAKFKAQMKHLTFQYNSFSSNDQESPVNKEDISMNETSVYFKVQLLVIIYIGNINYSIHQGPNKSDKSFFKLNYDYTFLKNMILNKLNCFKDLNIEYLQTMTLFFQLSLSYDNGEGDDYLTKSSSNASFLIQLSSIINNYLISLLSIDKNSSTLMKFSGTNISSIVNNVNILETPSSHTIDELKVESLSLKLYWTHYILNSFLILKIGDYNSNEFLKNHYSNNYQSLLKIPDIRDSKSCSNTSMCELIDLFKIINEYILFNKDPIYSLTTENGETLKVKNDSVKDSQYINWENELFLLSPKSLFELFDKLTEWQKNSKVMNNDTNSLSFIQFKMIVVHIKTLIKLKSMNFIIPNESDNQSIELGELSREMLTMFIKSEFFVNDYHDDSINIDENRLSPKRRKLSMSSEWDSSSSINSSSTKVKPILVKSIEQEFISSIISKGLGMLTSEYKCESSVPFSKSYLGQEIDNFFTINRSNFTIQLFFKSLESIMVSTSNRETRRSSASSFKTGITIIPLPLLEIILMNCSILTKLSETHYKSGGSLMKQSVKSIIESLIVIVKNYELDSTNHGVKSNNKWYYNWVLNLKEKIWAICKECDLLSTPKPSYNLQSEFTDSLISMSPSNSIDSTTNSLFSHKESTHSSNLSSINGFQSISIGMKRSQTEPLNENLIGEDKALNNILNWNNNQNFGTLFENENNNSRESNSWDKEEIDDEEVCMIEKDLSLNKLVENIIFPEFKSEIIKESHKLQDFGLTLEH